LAISNTTLNDLEVSMQVRYIAPNLAAVALALPAATATASNSVDGVTTRLDVSQAEHIGWADITAFPSESGDGTWTSKLARPRILPAA
jgi:hypothetical protein